MKRLMITTALIVAAASSAMASNSATTLSAAQQFEIRTVAPGADLSTLSVAQIAEFNGLFATPDNRGAGDDFAGQVRAILTRAN